ncbi:MAG TPA: PAS domain-containing protein, partial [Thermohalobaculum sp.]|nr:PAS domain-containing protein [Thermohalobaculum sp.]
KTEMIHSEIRALYGYWEALRGQRPCPYRAEVDPRDMNNDARHLFLLEDLGDGNVRFRLAGTALHDAFGFDLRGMSLRAIMAGKARESLVALVSETLSEPGIGYARLLAPDGVQVWEIVLLPLRSDFGQVDRLIGCLHPVNGRAPVAGDVPLRFTIEEASIRPVENASRATPGDTGPLAGFAEGQVPFTSAATTPGPNGLTAIEGGLTDGRGTGGDRPVLRVVKDEE